MMRRASFKYSRCNLEKPPVSTKSNSEDTSIQSFGNFNKDSSEVEVAEVTLLYILLKTSRILILSMGNGPC